MIKCTNCEVCEAKDKGHVDLFDEDNTAWITFESEDDVQCQVAVKDIRCSKNIQLGSIICLKHNNSMCVCEDRWEESDDDYKIYKGYHFCNGRMEYVEETMDEMKKFFEEASND